MRAPREIGAANVSPWRVTLTIAIAGHAVALAFAAFLAPPARLFARTPNVVVTSLDLTITMAIDEAPLPEVERATLTPEPRPEAGASEANEDSETRRGPAARSEPTGPPASETPPTTGPTGTGEYDPLPDRRPRLPGLDGAPAWSVPGVIGPLARSAPAPTTTPRPRIDRDAGGRAIRSTLDARDHDRGMALPAANEVALAIEAVMESAETPGESRATFTVDLDASGSVKSVALANATAGDQAMWARVIARIKRALASRRLTMRGDAAALGAKLSVRIDTRERFPDGRKGTTGTNEWGEHRSRVVLAHVDVIVPGAKRLPEDIKPVVIQPFFTPPDPKKSGVVPLNPGDSFRLHTPQQ